MGTPSAGYRSTSSRARRLFPAASWTSHSTCFARLRVTLVSLDTRQKIVPLDRALEQIDGSNSVVVNGYFDPLTAAHVRRLRELHAQAGQLIAVVVDPPEP